MLPDASLLWKPFPTALDSQRMSCVELIPPHGGYLHFLVHGVPPESRRFHGDDTVFEVLGWEPEILTFVGETEARAWKAGILSLGEEGA